MFVRFIILSVSLIIFSHSISSALYPEDTFNWSQVLETPPGVEYTKGNQVLHFKSQNKHYSQSISAQKFVKNFLGQAAVLPSDAEVLKFASDNVTIKGVYIELGVCTGKTINYLAALNPHHVIHGFDSFHGLPSDWVREDVTIKTGAFGFKNPAIMPPVLHNVNLYKGLFKETLPQFKSQYLKSEPIALLHVDCDLYESTKTAFSLIGDNLVNGSIIIFDEFYNYPGSEHHEWKAFTEFLEYKQMQAEYIAYNPYHEQVVVRLY